MFRYFWLLFSVVALSAAEPLQITQFRSDKILYDFGETAHFSASVHNPGAARTVQARLTLKHGVKEQITLPAKNVTLPAKGSCEIQFSWPVGRNEYGFAAQLQVADRKSDTIIFEVCHDWRKINRAGGKPTYHGIFSPDFTDAQIDELITFCRDWGYNRFHVFGSWMPEIDDFKGRREPWQFWMAKEPNAPKNWIAPRISSERIKRFIQKFHDNGIKVTMYMHTPTYKLQTPDWIVYDPLRPGKRKHYPGDSAVRQAYLEKNNHGVPNAMLFAREVGEKLAGAIHEFGWDGIFMDDFRRLVEYTEKGVDAKGQALSKQSHSALHREVLHTLVRQVKPAKDNFAFFLNGLHHALYAIQNFPSRDMFGTQGEKFDETASASVGNFAYAGEWRDITRQANSPYQLGRSLRAIREVTRTPLDIVWTIAVPESHAKNDAAFHGSSAAYTSREETVLPFTAIIMANGIGYSEYYTSCPRGFYTDVRKNPLAAKRVAYLKFAARYGQYIYDLTTQWTPRDEVKVNAPEQVYWKGNSFERKVHGGREVIVHMINFDKPYLYAQLWDRERKNIPPVDGITASVKLRSGERCESVYAATPDDGGEPVKLASMTKNNVITATSPKLHYWNMLVFNIRENGQ